MSTILKALRRLEDDDPKKKRAGSTASPPRDAAPSPGFPATDPRAADALRGRILAEEAAAHAVRSLSNESIESARNRRPVVLASLAACAVVAGLAFLFARSGLFASEPSDTPPPSVSASTPQPARRLPA